MKLTISVEEFHIKYGERRNPARCPLAFAIGPRTGGHVEITGNGTVEIYNLAWRLMKASHIYRQPIRKQYPGDMLLLAVPLPEDAVRRVKEYDSGGTMGPFSFELELPEDWREKVHGKHDRSSEGDLPEDGNAPYQGL